nr:MAG TPA: hypothetical protein [Bacteriophage sp.]
MYFPKIFSNLAKTKNNSCFKTGGGRPLNNASK